MESIDSHVDPAHLERFSLCLRTQWVCGSDGSSQLHDLIADSFQPGITALHGKSQLGSRRVPQHTVYSGASSAAFLGLPWSQGGKVVFR